MNLVIRMSCITIFLLFSRTLLKRIVLIYVWELECLAHLDLHSTPFFWLFSSSGYGFSKQVISGCSRVWIHSMFISSSFWSVYLTVKVQEFPAFSEAQVTVSRTWAYLGHYERRWCTSYTAWQYWLCTGCKMASSHNSEWKITETFNLIVLAYFVSEHVTGEANTYI